MAASVHSCETSNPTTSSTSGVVKIKLVKKKSKERLLLEHIPNPLLTIPKSNSKSDLSISKKTQKEGEPHASTVSKIQNKTEEQNENVGDLDVRSESSVEKKEEKTNKKRKKPKHETDDGNYSLVKQTSRDEKVSKTEQKTDTTVTPQTVKNKKLKLDKSKCDRDFVAIVQNLSRITV